MGFLHDSIDDLHSAVSFPGSAPPPTEPIYDDLTLCVKCLNPNSVTADVVYVVYYSSYNIFF